MFCGYRKMLAVVITSSLCCGLVHAQDPVQVFILAGQSNMQGHGWYDDITDNGIDELGTLRKLVEANPVTYGHLLDGSDNWVVRDDVWIRTTDGNLSGALTVGFGANTDRIGPEFGFGHVIGDTFSEDVLIIKTAWGGKSLIADFRPPSAVQKRGGVVGAYYNLILTEVSNVLSNIGTHVPGYVGQGYELKGFGWHQGWNDRVNQAAVDEYEENLVDFINDIRFDLAAADLPFVVANTGIGGFGETNQRALDLMQAQLNVGNPSLYPEFDGNVKAINTQGFWRDASVSPITSGNQGFHWNQNGETLFLIGDAMGDEMATMSDYVQFERQFLEVNQLSGEIKIVNPSTNLEDMDLEAYQITSASGALNTGNWTPITGNHDGQGDASVDSGNWTVDTASTGELSESAVPGGADGLIAIGNEVSLGVGAWIQNPTKDLLATYTDTDGTVSNLGVVYVGAEHLFADLTSDGSITAADWQIFAANIQTNMSALSGPEAYKRGDLDGDFDNDIDDFDLFREAYELDNPEPGAFAAMLAEYAVPEPSSFVLLGMGILGLSMRRRRARFASSVFPGQPNHSGATLSFNLNERKPMTNR
jgi:hypothetical protein